MYNNSSIYFQDKSGPIETTEKVEIVKKGKRKKKKKTDKKPARVKELEQILSKGGKEGLLYMVLQLLKDKKPKEKEVKSKVEYNKEGFIVNKERKKRPKKAPVFASRAAVNKQRASEIASRLQETAKITKDIKKRKKILEEVDGFLLKAGVLSEEEKQLVNQFYGSIDDLTTELLEREQKKLKLQIDVKETKAKEKKITKAKLEEEKRLGKLSDIDKQVYTTDEEREKLSYLYDIGNILPDARDWIMKTVDASDMKKFKNKMKILDSFLEGEIGSEKLSKDELVRLLASSKKKPLKVIIQLAEKELTPEELEDLRKKAPTVKAEAGRTVQSKLIEPDGSVDLSKLLNSLVSFRPNSSRSMRLTVKDVDNSLNKYSKLLTQAEQQELDDFLESIKTGNNDKGLRQFSNTDIKITPEEATRIKKIVEKVSDRYIQVSLFNNTNRKRGMGESDWDKENADILGVDPGALIQVDLGIAPQPAQPAQPVVVGNAQAGGGGVFGGIAAYLPGGGGGAPAKSARVKLAEELTRIKRAGQTTYEYPKDSGNYISLGEMKKIMDFWRVMVEKKTAIDAMGQILSENERFSTVYNLYKEKQASKAQAAEKEKSDYEKLTDKANAEIASGIDKDNPPDGSSLDMLNAWNAAIKEDELSKSSLLSELKWWISEYWYVDDDDDDEPKELSKEVKEEIKKLQSRVKQLEDYLDVNLQDYGFTEEYKEKARELADLEDKIEELEGKL